jgi:hypothetical protein
MKLIILTALSLTLITFTSSVYANKSLCNTTNIDKFLEAKKIKFINISTPKSKKWGINYFKIFKDPSDAILKKYKKKFSANIKVLFDNGLECSFQSKIRVSGDWKDHMSSSPPITSLDVKLLSGNINHTVKFKLFIPNTRGGDNEVFTTALLKELGFLAPKTYHVPATFNGQETIFLFQEKITKEFIESNHLRESSILEGDERFLFANDSFDKYGLTRIINDKWSAKGDASLSISKVALMKLNKIYFRYLSGKFIYKNRNRRFLSFSFLLEGKFIDKHREFQAILVAIGAAHGLRPHNRSFYYDPIYRYFKPIYYDGDSTITKLNGNLNNFTRFCTRISSKIRSKEFSCSDGELNKDEIIGSLFALESLQKLDRKNFHAQIKNLGLDYSLEMLNNILDQVSTNLKTIKNSKILNHKKNPYIPYFSNLKDLGLDNNKKKLAFYTKTKSRIEICDLLLTSCHYDTFTIKNYSKLLSGRYLDDEKNSYIFLGNKQEYLTGVDIKTYEKKREINLEDGAKLVTYGSSIALVNKKEKIITLKQNDINDRFLIKGEKLKDWHIEFTGLIDEKINSNQRFNQNLLTGCLTLLDLNIDNVNIEANGALCEDAVNFVRVNGTINNITITNALSDAIDVDFSKLNFKKINIKDAGNDCVDLSSGIYHIEHADLSNCKDKAISVGENSRLTINSAQILKSNLGVAAKDSSVVKVNAINFNTTNICFNAYNKKQEYWGGKIIIGKHNCQSNQIIQQENSLVEFIQ